MSTSAVTIFSRNFPSPSESSLQNFENTLRQKQYHKLAAFRDSLPKEQLIKGAHNCWLPIFAVLCEDMSCPVDVILHFSAYTDAITPLQWAVSKNRLDVLDELLKSLAEEEIHSTFANEHNLLHLITSETDLRIVRSLLNKGISLEQRDGFGNTPSHTAAAANRLDVLDLYARYRADLSAQNNAQESVFTTWAIRMCLRGQDLPLEDFLVSFKNGIAFFLDHFDPPKIFPAFKAKIPYYFEPTQQEIASVLEILRQEEETYILGVEA